MPEIISPVFNQAILYAFANDGSLKWTSPKVTYQNSPTLADLDGDGQSEILFGTSSFNSDGSIRWDRARSLPGYKGGAGYQGASLAADLDGDGFLDVISGPSAIDKDGGIVWSWAFKPGSYKSGDLRGTLDRGNATAEVTSYNFLSDGHNAVADSDRDARPEVIVLSSSSSMTSPVMGTSMWIFEHDGRHKANFGLFENVFNVVSYEIGPPTVADFDGDGEPEIAIPGYKRLVDCGRTNPDDPCRYFLSLYRYRSSDNSLQLLWRKDLIGHLSVIGLAVTAFDFDADGAAEMVLQDSQKLYILNGRDGASLFEMGVERTNEGAGAGTRYPTVADVDNDGVPEIIVPTTTSYKAGSPTRSGVLVLGNAKGNWRNARPVWNQWQYHVTNVEENGRIPAVQPPNWQILNSHRTQSSLYNVGNLAAPDLTVSKVRKSIRKAARAKPGSRRALGTGAACM